MALRLAFMGTPDFAVPTFQALRDAGHDIVCIYSQPPSKAGRGQKERPSPVHQAALDAGIEVRTPQSLKKNDAAADFAALDLDAAIIVAYGLILPPAILGAPKFGCFNVHGSLLPRWRGAAPLQRAVMAGDAETGVTIMKMDEGLDTGPMALVRTLPLTEEMTAGDVHDRLGVMGADAMVDALALLEQDKLALTPQPDDGVTYAAKIDKAEARIDWTRPAEEVAAHIRGLSPFPGAWSELEGKRVKLLHAMACEGGGDAGTALDDQLTIACGTGAIRVTRLQKAGKAAMTADDFLRGQTVLAGSQFK